MAAARSLASLSISFGLVSIPVNVYTATESASGVGFNLLHKGCGARLKQYYECPVHGRVERADMVRGYEFEKDKYVIFEPAELEALEATARHTIDIVSFMPIDAIDPIFFDKPYFLAPDKRGGKPYQLLARAMADTGTCALARWVWKGKGHMVQLRASADGIVAQTLLYADEVRSQRSLDIGHPEPDRSELQLAQQLIDQYRVDSYDAAAYRDEEKDRILAAIDKKIAGKKITAPPEAAKTGGEVIDLMEALRRSLQKPRSAAAKKGAGEEVVVPTKRKGVRRAAPSAAPATPARKTATRK